MVQIVGHGDGGGGCGEEGAVVVMVLVVKREGAMIAPDDGMPIALLVTRLWSRGVRWKAGPRACTG